MQRALITAFDRRVIEVILNWSQTELGVKTGTRRQFNSLVRGDQHKHGYHGDRNGEPAAWENHIQSACAECATGAGLNRHWYASVDAGKAPDVAPDIQVRWRSRDSYDLIVRPDDKPEEKFVLVYGEAPRFQLIGWMLGQDAMQDEFAQTYGDRPKAWFVPKPRLHNIEELIQAL